MPAFCSKSHTLYAASKLFRNIAEGAAGDSELFFGLGKATAGVSYGWFVMAKAKVSFDAVRKIGLALPGVEETTSWGFPTLKVHGQLLACVPANKSAEPNSLVVRVNMDDRAHLLEEAPDVYYITDHYAGYTAVLVRLSYINEDTLRDLLGMAHKFVTTKLKRSSSRKSKKTKRTTK